MTEAQRLVTFVVCIFCVLLGVLVGIGVGLGSKWDTFVPDLIIGVVGAGAIAGIVALTQHLAENRRDYNNRVTAAYENLLEAVAPLRITDLRQVDDGSRLTDLVTKMIVLGETVNDDLLLEWFEAERQVGLLRGAECDARLKALDKSGEPAGTTARFVARAPFNQWAANLGDNLRFWRSGRFGRAEMTKQTSQLLKYTERTSREPLIE